MSNKKYVLFSDNRENQYYMPIDYIKYLKCSHSYELGKYTNYVFTEIGDITIDENTYRKLINLLEGEDNEC